MKTRKKRAKKPADVWVVLSLDGAPLYLCTHDDDAHHIHESLGKTRVIRYTPKESK